MSKIKIRNEAHWHELRAKHVGGSDLAALYGESPYKTKCRLWQEKAGHAEPEDISNNSAVLRGIYMEPGAANWWAHGGEYIVSPATDYWTNDAGLGTTPDFIASRPDTSGERGLYHPLEIKTCDWLKWKDLDEQPMMTWVLQLQAQLLTGGYERGCIAVWYDMNTAPVSFWYEADKEIQAKIEADVAVFWQSIKDGKEPDPVNVVDQELAAKIRIAGLGDNRPPEIDLSGSKKAAALAKMYFEGQVTEKTGKGLKSESKAGLVALLDGALRAKGVEDENYKYSISNKSRFNFVATPKKERT